MRLETQRDVELPVDVAFREIADVARLERQLLRRGVDVMRRDMMAEPGPGMSWAAEVEIAGRFRDAVATIEEWQPPARAVLQADIGQIAARMTAEFTALSRQTTRMRVMLHAEASGLKGRLFLRSSALSKRRLEARLSDLLGDYVQSAEARAAQV